jgi:serine/threonine protein kinase
MNTIILTTTFTPLNVIIYDDRTEPLPEPAAVGPEPQPTPRLAEALFGRHLGLGFTSNVVEALVPSTDPTGRPTAVAAKIVKRNDYAEQNFADEVAAYHVLTPLAIPGIVTCLGHAVVGGSSVLYLELCPHGDLLSAIEKHNGGLPPRIATRFARDLVVTLALMHGNGVTHGDIKSNNVLLASDGTVRLADFGTALTGEQSLWSQDSASGTPEYKSPEKWHGHLRRFQPRTDDVFALGVTVFEMLLGARPFTKRSIDYDCWYMGKISTGAWAAFWPQFIQDDPVSPNARDFLQRCLDPNPQTRPSAAELLHHPWFGEPMAGDDAALPDELQHWINELNAVR